MVKQGTFITPTGLFLVSGSIMYVVTAILHPQECTLVIYGLMYFICIPSGYLLLTIYSLVNMHIVSWGTRESNKGEENKKKVGVVCNRDCRLCCWDVKIEVTQETENLMLQQIQQAVNPSARAAAKPEPTSQSTEDHLHVVNTDKLISDHTKQVTHNKDEHKKNLLDNKDGDTDSQSR